MKNDRELRCIIMSVVNIHKEEKMSIGMGIVHMTMIVIQPQFLNCAII